MEAIYKVTVTSYGGRDGKVVSEDGNLNLEIKRPTQMGGQGHASNPEQLFAAGYAACFNSAMQLAARLRKIHVDDSIVHVTVGLQDNKQGGYILAADIKAEIKGVTQEQAEVIAEAGHHICPYSNATRGNINVTLEVKAV